MVIGHGFTHQCWGDIAVAPHFIARIPTCGFNEPSPEICCCCSKTSPGDIVGTLTHHSQAALQLYPESCARLYPQPCAKPTTASYPLRPILQLYSCTAASGNSRRWGVSSTRDMHTSVPQTPLPLLWQGIYAPTIQVLWWLPRVLIIGLWSCWCFKCSARSGPKNFHLAKTSPQKRRGRLYQLSFLRIAMTLYSTATCTITNCWPQNTLTVSQESMWADGALWRSHLCAFSGIRHTAPTQLVPTFRWNPAYRSEKTEVGGYFLKCADINERQPKKLKSKETW